MCQFKNSLVDRALSDIIGDFYSIDEVLEGLKFSVVIEIYLK